MTNIFAKAIIKTPRLRLEPFAPAHTAALNAINNEAQVMKFLSNGTPETLDETKTKIARVRERWETLGYSWWAIIKTDSDTVIGAACAQNVANVPGADIEIGWRLATASNGHGYATEAGIAVANYAFEVIGVDHVVSVAHPDNIASHKVMQRVGMSYRGIETHYDEPCTTYVLHKSDANRHLFPPMNCR